MSFTQKTYSCVLRFQGSMNHAVPMELVTKHELQLLAFMHGTGSVVELRGRGEREMSFPEDADGKSRPVASEMDEFRRLAMKYDTLVNSGRGKKAVEVCFHTRIEDFGAIITEVDAREAILAAADAADAEAVLAQGGADHAKIAKQLEEVEKTNTGVGSRFAETAKSKFT